MHVFLLQTSDVGMTHNSSVSGLCFEIWFRRRKRGDTYTLKASGVEVKKAWTADLERILWDQAAHSRGASSCHAALLLFVNSFAAMSLEGTLSRCCVLELRMQERVFMGMGRKPFMDIQPSDAAICDRAVNCVLPGRSKDLHAKTLYIYFTVFVG